MMKVETPPVVDRAFAAVAYRCRLWLRVLVREYDEGGLQFRAMSLVYTTLLALAPMLAVSFSVLKAFGVHMQMQPMLLNLLEPLGANATEIGEKLVGFVENIQVGVLGFVGFLMLFYTATSLLHQVEDCFNHIWRVERPRSLYRRFSDYLTVILIGPVLLFSAMGIATSMNNAAVIKMLIAMEPFGTLYYGLGLILPYLLAIAAFTLLIAFVPNVSVQWLPALVGGSLAAIVWKGCGILFSMFMANSAQYSAIYSGFAIILLSMIWLYLSWLIVLLGGVIAFHNQFPRYLRYGSRLPVMSMAQREQLGLRLMYSIGRHHCRDTAVCTLPDLANEVDMPWESVAEVLQAIQDAGFLLTLDVEPKTYVLAHDTDAIYLRDILDAVRRAGCDPSIASVPPVSALAPLFDAIERWPADLVGDATLRSLILRAES